MAGLPRGHELLRNVPMSTLQDLDSPAGLACFKQADLVHVYLTWRGLGYLLFGREKLDGLIEAQRGDYLSRMLIEVNTPRQLSTLCYVCSQFRGRCDYSGPDFDAADRAELRRLPSDN